MAVLCNDQVQLVPMSGTWVSPGDFMLQFGPKKGVGDTQIMKCAELKQTLLIFIHVDHSIMT